MIRTVYKIVVILFLFNCSYADDDSQNFMDLGFYITMLTGINSSICDNSAIIDVNYLIFGGGIETGYSNDCKILNNREHSYGYLTPYLKLRYPYRKMDVYYNIGLIMREGTVEKHTIDYFSISHKIGIRFMAGNKFVFGVGYKMTGFSNSKHDIRDGNFFLSLEYTGSAIWQFFN